MPIVTRHAPGTTASVVSPAGTTGSVPGAVAGAMATAALGCSVVSVSVAEVAAARDAETRSSFSQLSLPRSSKATTTLPSANRNPPRLARCAVRSTRPCCSDSVAIVSSGSADPAALSDSEVRLRLTSCTTPDRVPAVSIAKSKLAPRSTLPASESMASRRGRLLTSVATCRPPSFNLPFTTIGLSARSPLVSSISPAAVCADSR